MTVEKRYDNLRGQLAEILELAAKFPDVEAMHLTAFLQEDLASLDTINPHVDESSLADAEQEVTAWLQTIRLAAQLRGLIPPPVIVLGDPTD